MHVQIHSAILQLSQTVLASWEFGKRQLEKTRLIVCEITICNEN